MSGPERVFTVESYTCRPGTTVVATVPAAGARGFRAQLQLEGVTSDASVIVDYSPDGLTFLFFARATYPRDTETDFHSWIAEDRDVAPVNSFFRVSVHSYTPLLVRGGTVTVA